MNTSSKCTLLFVCYYLVLIFNTKTPQFITPHIYCNFPDTMYCPLPWDFSSSWIRHILNNKKTIEMLHCLNAWYFNIKIILETWYLSNKLIIFSLYTTLYEISWLSWLRKSKNDKSLSWHTLNTISFYHLSSSACFVRDALPSFKIH